MAAIIAAILFVAMVLDDASFVVVCLLIVGSAVVRVCVVALLEASSPRRRPGRDLE